MRSRASMATNRQTRDFETKMIFASKFNAKKLKPALKMSLQRIELLRNKKTSSIQTSKSMVVSFLKDGKEEKARVLAEGLVRDDFLIEAYGIVELMCEIVLQRIQLIATSNQCPFDLREAICSLIFAATRTEIPELGNVIKQFKAKYGKEFIEAAQDNVDNCVNQRIAKRLAATPPNAFIVLNYMKDLARENDFNWVPEELVEASGQRFDSAMIPPAGGSVFPGMASGLGSDAYKINDGSIEDINLRDAAPEQGKNGKSFNGETRSDALYDSQSGYDASNDFLDIPSASDYDTPGRDLPEKNGSMLGEIPRAPGTDGLNTNHHQFEKSSNDDDDARGSTSEGRDWPTEDEDTSTYGKDPKEVPDFDELTARFDALSKN